MNLNPVSFARPRRYQPRLSAPYVPGKRDKRFWTDKEIEIVRRYFSEGGAAACLARLPAHRTSSGVYGQAKKLGVKAKGAPTGRRRYEVSPELDDRIREGWRAMEAGRKGAVVELAKQLQVRRWWLTKRMTFLGLTIRHKKEPRWTAAEDALMHKVPLHLPDKAAAIFREHGFRRSPTAIVVRAKRLALSRRASRPELSATKAAQSSASTRNSSPPASSQVSCGRQNGTTNASSSRAAVRGTSSRPTCAGGLSTTSTSWISARLTRSRSST